jgi:hypothetical protein
LKASGKSKKKTARNESFQPKRVSLDSIKLRGILERPQAQSQCGRDVTFMVNEKNEEVCQWNESNVLFTNTCGFQVGGMIFGAFTEEELCFLRKDRDTFPKAAVIGRGRKFQPWRFGTMQAVGSRMPSGGRPGDTYTVYPGMEINDDVGQVRKLFKVAKVGVISICCVCKQLK